MRVMIEIYTDGSCANVTSKKGGAAYVVVKDNQVVDSKVCGYLNTTNNRMELRAIISALQYCIDTQQDAMIYSDSQYCVNGYNSWMHKWFRPGRSSKYTSGKLLNADLWVQIFELSKQTKAKLSWVRGHSTNSWNNYADELCSYNKFSKYEIDEVGEMAAPVLKKTVDDYIFSLFS
jgi:ribonuclease HI